MTAKRKRKYAIGRCYQDRIYVASFDWKRKGDVPSDLKWLLTLRAAIVFETWGDAANTAEVLNLHLVSSGDSECFVMELD